MKKRLLCLLLVLVMVVACLASCGEKSEEEAVENLQEDASESAMTLSMYLLAENLPADEDARAAQIASVEAAVNKITKAKFKTQIDLRVYATEEEYYAALDTAYAKRAEAAANGTLSIPEEGDETKEDETFADELGVVQILYPEIRDYQVDIMYLGGYDKYSEYMAAERLQTLDTDLDSSAKKIKEYVSTSYLKYMKSTNNGTYAIPANAPIGEYTYLLLDETVLKNLKYDTDEGVSKIGTNLAGEEFAKYLKLVKDYANNDEYKVEGGNTYVPFASSLTNTELASLCIINGTGSDGSSTVPSKIHYFGVDENGQFTPSKFSLFSGTADTAASFGNKNSYMPGAYASVAPIKGRLDKIMEYRYEDLLVDVKEGEKAAVKCVKGSYGDRETYEEQGYRVVVVEKPMLETADLYRDMFAVSKNTSSTSRSMEIITYLYTNEEFHNLLMYGVEGEDYELVDHENDDGSTIEIVKDIDPDYSIAAEKLGNTLIGHYSLTDTPEYRASVMKHNNNATVDIMMGFTHTDVITPGVIDTLAALSAEFETLINSFDPATAEEYWGVAEDTATNTSAVPGLRDKIDDLYKANSNKLTAINSGLEPKTGETSGLLYAYTKWATDTGIYVAPEE